MRILDSLLHQIHGSDLTQSSSLRVAREHGDVIVGDVRSEQDVEQALDGVSRVVHLAAETGTGQSMYAVSRYCDTNVQGTSVLLDLLSRGGHSVERVVVASSRAVYGEGSAECAVHGEVFPSSRKASDMERGLFAPRCPLCGGATVPLPTDELCPVQPSSVYAITKLTQEQLVLTVCGSLGIPASALRYQNVYGPGQSLTNPYTGILSIFSAAILDRREINVFEDGLESRDFVYIDDVVEATAAAVMGDSGDGEVINVGSGVRSTVLEVLAALAASYDVEPHYRISGDFRLGDIRHNVADTHRMHELLGVSAGWSLNQGIGSFAQWARQELERGLDGCSSYEQSLQEIKERGLLLSSKSGADA